MNRILLVYLVSCKVSDSMRFFPQALMHIFVGFPGARLLNLKSLLMLLVFSSLMQPILAYSVPFSKLHFRRSTIISVLLILNASTEQFGVFSAANYKTNI